MLAQSVNYVTLDKAPRPTKSEWDSADTEAYRAYRRSFTKSDGDNAEKAVTATSCDRLNIYVYTVATTGLILDSN